MPSTGISLSLDRINIPLQSGINLLRNKFLRIVVRNIPFRNLTFRKNLIEILGRNSLSFSEDDGKVLSQSVLKTARQNFLPTEKL